MKNPSEILARTVILQNISSRCAAELNICGGIYHSLEEREEHRQTILKWSIEKGYDKYFTDDERRLFELPAGEGDKEDILTEEYQCKAMEVLLWSLGLLDSLPDYSHFRVEEYYDLLDICAQHTLEDLLAKCHFRTEDEIEFERCVAMLWHWRAMESDSQPAKGKTWSDSIKEIFGEEFEEVLKCIPHSKKANGDFLVGKKPVSKLSDTEKELLYIVAYWRHHAFEWIVGEQSWDEIFTDT